MWRRDEKVGELFKEGRGGDKGSRYLDQSDPLWAFKMNAAVLLANRGPQAKETIAQ